MFLRRSRSSFSGLKFSIKAFANGTLCPQNAKRVPQFSCYVVHRKHFCQSSSAEGTTSEGPLSGIRVLDLTRILAGPYATMVLGDLGAEVIKVERPGNGDMTRGWGPPYIGTESAYFLSINRNKKSICIDFQKKEGQQLIKDLAKKSDVLVENLLPGKMASLGIGYEDLKEDCPQLVFCSLTGYGQSGPYKDRGGFDVVAAAQGGLMHITGPEDGEPCRVGVAITDITTGLYAHGAIMAALLDRYRTGKGKKIDCSLLSTQVAVLCHIAVSYLNAGVDMGRTGTGHHSIVPYQAFKTTDGYFVVGAGSDKQFKELCEILEEPSLAEDPEFATNSKRVVNRQKLIPILMKKFDQHDTDYWIKCFEGSSLPYGPINNLQQVFNDPQVKHMGLALGLDHPSAGHIRMPGPAVLYDGQRLLNEPLPPPLLGQHTREVLNDVLQIDDQRIEQLLRSKVVATS